LNRKNFEGVVANTPPYSPISEVRKGDKSSRLGVATRVCGLVAGGNEKEGLKEILKHTRVGRMVQKENIQRVDGFFGFNAVC
jgi:hypothetical protein